MHPREVDAHFAHGRVRNWFGGSSRATTQLLDGMHYRGLLRIARRDAGVRLYAAREPTPPPADSAEPGAPRRAGRPGDRQVRAAAVAPRSASWSATCAVAARRSGRANAPRRWRARGRGIRRCALDGIDWYWPAGENPRSQAPCARRDAAPARALRPGRLGPAPLRAVLGLGLPLRGLHAGRQAQARLLRAAAAVARAGDRLGQPGLARRPARCRLGYVAGRAPREPPSARALDEELARITVFLRLSGRCSAASSAPTASSRADTTKPRARPPGPSAIQPTKLGPTICPAAKTMVKAAMPDGPGGRRQVVAHEGGGRGHHRQEHRAEQRARARTPPPDACSAPAAAWPAPAARSAAPAARRRASAAAARPTATTRRPPPARAARRRRRSARAAPAARAAA